jgi:hypothetical protein
MAAGEKPLGREVRRTAQLDDPRGDLVRVPLFLGRVLEKLRRDRIGALCLGGERARPGAESPGAWRDEK